MNLGPLPDYLKHSARRHLFTMLKDQPSLEAHELDLFEWFRQETEEAWAKMDAEERKYIREQVAAGVDDLNDSGVLAVDYYLRRMRHSHVIFLSSLLEGAMKRECDRLAAALGGKVHFTPSELKGDPWSARRTFLERHGLFEIPIEIWKPINSLLAVRNALVHHSGEVSLLTAEQIRALRRISGVEVGSSEIGITKTYVEQASVAIRDLMNYIHAKTNLVLDRSITPEAV